MITPRMCWVYLLKHKSQAFETFKNFHVWIENEAQSHIGTLCTDNGGEYTSNEFESYLHQHGIKHQTIVPYNPQQNGVAERMNVISLRPNPIANVNTNVHKLVS
jgi:transposase InsO family protein